MKTSETVPLSVSIQKSLNEYLIGYLIIYLFLMIVVISGVFVYAVMGGVPEITLPSIQLVILYQLG